MELIDVIKSYEAAMTAAAAGNWTAVVEIVAAHTVTVKDSTARTASWLSTTFVDPVGETGLTEADVVLGTLQASTIPRVKAAYQTMTVSGLDFADDSVQSMLPQLATAGGWPDGLADRLASFGVTKSKPFDGVTAGECETTWKSDILSDRLVNFAALCSERLAASDTTEQQAAKIAQAWADSEAV